MNEEINKTIEAISGLSETIPMIYKDVAQPAAQEVGKGIHTLSKTIHMALAPVSALVWSYEKISNYIHTSLEEKLKNVSQEKIKTPDPTIAVPAIEALRYTAQNDELRELFSNLIASSMNKETSQLAHPSFVEIIKQINSDEAKIIKLLVNDQSIPIMKLKSVNKETTNYAEPIQEFSLLPYQANCEFPELGPSYLVNISRLGLAEIDYTSYNTLPNAYGPLNNHPFILNYSRMIENLDLIPEIKNGIFSRTQFGKKFYETCIDLKF